MTRLLPGDSLTLDLAPEDPADLLARLRAAGVAMNESAERLITDAQVCAAVPERVTVVERTLADLFGLGGILALVQHVHHHEQHRSDREQGSV